MSIVMKKIILLLLFVAVAAIVRSQDSLSYKPLSSFKNDTVAYLVYNFETRADSYKGKTIDEVLKDLRIPVISYKIHLILHPIGFRALRLFINSNTDITNENCYYLGIASMTNYTKYVPFDGEWTENIYESLKSIVVTGIGVSVPMNSEYYKERQKKWEQERKERKEKEASRFIISPAFHKWDPDMIKPDTIKKE